ncbi:hypothetical protein BDR06DRAFT_984888 [Suillus hirtellus]|nr:hypothetical protein BDR06DRAFT_984888 [Suillus hirtellus]
MSLPMHTPVWHIKNSPQDSVVLDFSDNATFALTEEPMPHKDVLPEHLYTTPVHKGDVMVTHSITCVLTLKDNTSHGFKVNNLVYCLTAGWVPKNVSPTVALDLFGVPGFTVYYGLRDILKLKEGESLIVSMAVGAVGNVIIQYAKKVIKAKNADVALNYKSDTFPQDLIDATLNFVDAYFDNVGLDVGKPTMGTTWIEVVTNCLSIKGFIIIDFMFPKDRSNRIAMEAFLDIAGALQQGDIMLECAKDIVEAPFIDIPKIWGRLFTGANTGKLITKLTFSA